MLNKIRYIAFTAAISMAACVFGENVYICSDKQCSLDCVVSSRSSTNRVELSNYLDANKWYCAVPAVILSNDLYTVVKPGYKCSWYTFSSDNESIRDDVIDNCNVLLLSDSYSITYKRMADKSSPARRMYSGRYRLACAKLTPLQYQVTFDGNGGSSPSGITVTFDSKYAASEEAWPTPTRVGHDFNGWYTKKEGGTKILWNTTVSTPSNHTLYAQWTAHTWTAFLRSEKTATISPDQVEVTYGSPYPELPTPSCPGYDFDLWAREKSGSQPVTPGKTTVQTDEDHTLWAQWIAKQYEVWLDAGEGEISSTFENPKKVYFNDPFGFLPTAQCEGHTFSGWYSAKQGKANLIESGTIYTYPSNITIYARYEPKKFTLVYETHGGTIDGQYQKEITFGQPYGALPTPTRTGYGFGGWWTLADGEGTRITSTNIVSCCDAQQYIHAKWDALPYVVNFDFCGGDGGTSSTNVYYEKMMPDIVVPRKDGYSFTGYYDNVDYLGSSYYASNGKGLKNWDKTGDGVLYAKWGEKTYTVTFDKCGGSGGTASIEVTFNGAIPDVYVPNRTGYVFGGYWTEVEGGGDQYFDADGQPVKSKWDRSADTILFAKWTAISYSVSFRSNGGSGSMEDQQFSYDEAKPLSLNQFTKPGLHFMKWKKGSVFYTDGQVVSNLTAESEDVITLTAQWSETRYVKFVSENGVGAMDLEVFEGTEAKPLTSNAFVRTGYTFDHWTNSQNTVFADAQFITNSLYVKIAQTNDLHAVWSNNVYMISFDGNGATGSMATVSATYDVPQQVTVGFLHPDTAAEFRGWGLQKDSLDFPVDVKGGKITTVVNAASVSGTNVTLYAQWSIDYGDLSRALDCESSKLKFETDNGYWETNTDASAVNGTCVIHKTAGQNQKLYTRGLIGSGDLTFRVKTGVDQVELFVNIAGEQITNITSDVGGEWFDVHMKLTDMKVDQVLSFEHQYISKFGDWCCIDYLTWTPEQEHPEPTPADAPTITGGATIEGGKFRVTFAADKRFKYELIKTESLAPVDWKSFVPQMFISPDASGNVSFEPEMKPAEPQMFYRVKVLKKD